MALRHGLHRLTGLRLESCSAENGGGIYIDNRSAIDIVDSVLHLNNGSNGAGVYIDTSSFAGVNTRVEENSATMAGGGVFLGGAQPTLSGFTISKCVASRGGGIAALDALQTRILNIDIVGNEAQNSGGGLFASSSTLLVTSVAATSNIAVSGGGLYALASTIGGTLTLAFNNAMRGGGVVSSSSTTLKGVLVDSCTAKIGGGGIYAGDGTLTLRDVDVTACASVDGVGGGVYLANARALHDGVSVLACAANKGAGLYLESSSFTAASPLDRATLAVFLGNEATSLGGGVFIGGTDSSVDTFRVTNGLAKGSGGGLASENAERCTISNGLIQNASAGRFGGGVYFGENAACVFTDSRVEWNVASQAGGGIALQHASIQHSNVTMQFNSAKNGGGLYLSSTKKASPVSATLFNDNTTATRSQLDANFLTDASENGANALIECVDVCEIAGFIITRGVVANGKGGGVFVTGKGTIQIASISVSKNQASQGGGVAVAGANSTILTLCSFTENVARSGGAALSIESTSNIASHVEIRKSVIYNNTALQQGGGVFVTATSTFTGTELLMLENRAIQNESGIGGGVYAHSKSTLQLSESLFVHNRALYGGSIAVDAESTANLDDSCVTGDTNRFTSVWRDLFAQLMGGAAYQTERANQDFNVTVRRGHLVFISGENTEMTLTNATLTGGNAESGGGACVDSSAIMYIQQSEFSNNKAKEAGGSVFVTGSGAEVHLESSFVRASVSNNYGGGIYVQDSSQVFVMNSSILDNVADDSGGGIYLDTGDYVGATIESSVITGNMAKGQGCDFP
uniref:Right handed beta helix domain-containing protein n=1 Tax=Globisporangium ultimum (strain ATCC 200006 / CBS 805.95 / DAOM BR144) TaxID=431595 RepID=K3W6S4_GLOUD